MVNEHPNVQRYIHTICAFNENDLDAASKYCSENIVYRIAGKSPIAGEYHGIDNIIAYNDISGIEIQDSNSFGNAITQNSIHDNKEEGIYLWKGGNTEHPQFLPSAYISRLLF